MPFVLYSKERIFNSNYRYQVHHVVLKGVAHVNKQMIHLLPKRFLTNTVGAFATSSLSKSIIRLYATVYKIDLAEAEKPIHQYNTLAEFFSRKLQTHIRVPADNGILSPVDGTISTHGTIDHNMLLQAKGSTYTLEALLGDEAKSSQFLNGTYLTIYLSPRDYHRIHMPMDANVVEWKYIPGTLYPVNLNGVRFIPGLYTKNERLITYLKADTSIVAMVKIGATIVGSILTPYGPHYHRKRRSDRAFIQQGTTNIKLSRAEELGYFQFGSTVILLFPPGMIREFTVVTNDKVQMGQQIAR